MPSEPLPLDPSHPEADLAVISDLDTASVLLRDPRRAILDLARTPITAVEIADRLGESRQRLGYHVRCLVAAGLLRPEQENRRGAMVEKRYRASAGAYALSPELLGPLSARLGSGGDRESLAHLMGAVHEIQTDLVRVLSERNPSDSRVPTLTLSSRLRFGDAKQRGAFRDALVRALTQVVANYADAFVDAEGRPAPGAPFRLTLTLHPTPTHGDPHG